MALYLGIAFVTKHHPFRHGEWLGVPSLFLVPIVGGVVAAWTWRTLKLRLGHTAVHSLWTTLLGAGGAALFLGEGAVCLVIAFPILFIGIFTGAILGRVWFKNKGSPLQLCLVPCIALFATAEGLTRVDQQSVVVDQILINAPPAQIWPHILSFPEIPEPAGYWIFRLGLPYPTTTTNSGDFVGADRQCILAMESSSKKKSLSLSRMNG